MIFSFPYLSSKSENNQRKHNKQKHSSLTLPAITNSMSPPWMHRGLVNLAIMYEKLTQYVYHIRLPYIDFRRRQTESGRKPSYKLASAITNLWQQNRDLNLKFSRNDMIRAVARKGGGETLS